MAYEKFKKKHYIKTQEDLDEVIALYNDTKRYGVTRKIDGMHLTTVVTLKGTECFSRSGLKYNLPKLERELTTIFKDVLSEGESLELHGEIHYGRNILIVPNRWNETVSHIKRDIPNETDIYYTVYDLNSECTFETRREFLQTYITKYWLENNGETKVNIAEIHSVHHLKDFFKTVASGDEGLVIVDRHAASISATHKKVKPTREMDCIVTGIHYGKKGTRLENTIGALSIAYYDKENNKLISVGKCSTMKDHERDLWLDKQSYIFDGHKVYGVVECGFTELTSSNKLQFPIYQRERFDKPFSECDGSELLCLKS